MGTSQPKGDLWLFGYGSLIWKPPIHYGICFLPIHCPRDLTLQQTFGFPDIYTATFAASGSEDHRGTPEAPGRVVTLIERSSWETLTDHHASAPPRVWGAAYRIPAPKVAEVREYLDLREINGYSMRYTPFHMPASYQNDHNIPAPIDCLLYIGLPDNPQFLGSQDPQALAEHIVRSRGPSGENKDYLYELAVALLALSPESVDEHVQDLARRCREIEASSTFVQLA